MERCSFQQLADQRRGSCSFNCFNQQYLRQPNSCQQREISVMIKNYACRNQLIDVEIVVRSTTSIDNTRIDQKLPTKKNKCSDQKIYL